MYTDSDATYYAQVYSDPELRQLRTSASADLTRLATAPTLSDDDHELTGLLDRIRLYTAALRVLSGSGQLA